MLLSGLLLATAASADAQSRRHARVSRDLEQRLRAGDAEATSVIVSGSRERIARIAARHGLRIAKELETGAVLEVPAGTLNAVASDSEVDQLSTNHLVEAHMGVTNQTIGADLVQQGGWAPGIGPLTGAGIGVAVIDSGVALMPELRGRIVASKDFTDDRGLGLDQHGHGTHVAGIIAASGANRFDETRGVAPGANIISLKVLDAQGKGLAADVIQAIDWVVKNRAPLQHPRHQHVAWRRGDAKLSRRSDLPGRRARLSRRHRRRGVGGQLRQDGGRHSRSTAASRRRASRRSRSRSAR